jgi:hypothetical protein
MDQKWHLAGGMVIEELIPLWPRVLEGAGYVAGGGNEVTARLDIKEEQTENEMDEKSRHENQDHD